MESAQTQDHIDQFVLSLLRSGLLLTDIAGDLTESLPADAYPGEEPGAVVIEMMSGTIRSVLETVDPDLVVEATELMELALDRVEEHLRLAYACRSACTAARPGAGTVEPCESRRGGVGPDPPAALAAQAAGRWPLALSRPGRRRWRTGSPASPARPRGGSPRPR